MSSRGAGTLRVLFVPDSVHWILGTLARQFLEYNDGLRGEVISSRVLRTLDIPASLISSSFDVLHFTCPYASRDLRQALGVDLPWVASHHHVVRWEDIEHNLDGDAIVVASRAGEADLLARGVPRDRLVRIPYGVDTELFRPLDDRRRQRVRRSLGIDDRMRVVGFFAKRGSDDRGRKGVDVLLEAARRMQKEVADFMLLLVGPGWSGVVKELGKAGVGVRRVPFARTSQQVAQLYGVLDLYWVTSRVEGGPVTLLEAMSTGVASVTTRVGMVPEVVADGRNGAIIEVDDVEGLVSRSRALLVDETDRALVGRAARETIRSSFDARSTSRLVPQAYEVAIRNYERRSAGAASRHSPEDGVLSGVDRGSPHQESAHTKGVLPPAVRRQAEFLEELRWSHGLTQGGDHGAATRIAARQLLRKPTNPRAWRATFTHTRTFLRSRLGTLVRRVQRLRDPRGLR